MALLQNFQVTIKVDPILPVGTVFEDATTTIGSSFFISSQQTGVLSVTKFLIACSDSDLFKIELKAEGVLFSTFYTTANESIDLDLSHFFSNERLGANITRIGSGTADVKTVIFYTIV